MLVRIFHGRLSLPALAFAAALAGSGCFGPEQPRSGAGPRVREVLASYYGDEFQGRPTASGEPFDQHDFTAAHRSLPFGTRLRVTNPDNGSTIVVRVNDRGPFVRGRELDLTEAAARALGIMRNGVARLLIEEVRTGGPTTS